MALTREQIEQQKKEAEELLFAEQHKLGFAKALFFGHVQAPLLFPYPELPAEQRASVDKLVADVRRFCAEKIDAAAIDRNADIPPEVIAGLGQLSVLGLTAPEQY